MDGDIATGVREVVYSMREGEQRHLPYFTSVHGHRCLLSVPGRPPICFRCEEVGHQQCNGGSMPQSRHRIYVDGDEAEHNGEDTQDFSKRISRRSERIWAERCGGSCKRRRSGRRMANGTN